MSKDLPVFSIQDIPFSRRLSYISVAEDEGELRIYRQARCYGVPEKQYAVIRPLKDGKALPFKASSSVGLLSVETESGIMQFCFDGPETLRIRCVGIEAKIEESNIFKVTKLKNGEHAVQIVGYTPDCGIRSFDDCVLDSEADFKNWLSMYPRVANRHEAMKLMAVYMIWICQIAPRGKLKEPALLFSKPTDQSCFSWHQVYHAMVMRDPDCAVQTLMNLFQSQDEYGELPDLIDDRYINITATKPPFHGYGLLYLLERIGNSITTEHCQHMYGGLKKLYDFWTTLRDTDKDGIPQYNHGCESGYDFSLMFSEGVPVETPDIISYISLLAEGLGKLAMRLGMDSEAAMWEQKSQFLLNALVNEFWTGERFIARLSGIHEAIEFDELEAYLPLMLGGRLPKKIISKLAHELEDPDLYFTPCGLRSKPKQDGKRGVIMGFSQIKILPGLYHAGEKELAQKLLKGFCDWGAEHTPGFLFPEPMDEEENAFPQGFTGLSALSAAIWLGCASFLEEIENGKI